MDSKALRQLWCRNAVCRPGLAVWWATGLLGLPAGSSSGWQLPLRPHSVLSSPLHGLPAVPPVGGLVGEQGQGFATL